MAESSSTCTRASTGYERVMVPAVFAPWAKDLLETAALAPGMRVLDVACGTGIVARLAAAQVGPTMRSRAARAGTPELGQAAQTGLRHRHRTLPELRRQLEDHHLS